MTDAVTINKIDVVTININCICDIKLTDAGRLIYKRKWENLYDNLDPARRPKFEPLYEVDGVATLPLWEVMQLFGDHISMGLSTPFETDIVVYNTG